MARVAGVEIPDKKRVEVALQYIFGIGASLAQRILEEAKISDQLKVRQLTDEQLATLRSVISEGYNKIEGNLKKEISLNIKRLKDIRCYRGNRLGRLPVRGQKTKNNTRTCKGKRKTVANKKKVPAKK